MFSKNKNQNKTTKSFSSVDSASYTKFLQKKKKVILKNYEKIEL